MISINFSTGYTCATSMDCCFGNDLARILASRFTPDSAPTYTVRKPVRDSWRLNWNKLAGRTFYLEEQGPMSQHPAIQHPPTWTRRDLMRLAIALPAGAFLSNLKLFAEPHAGKVKIVDIKAMGLDHIAGNCLIRIDTDSGLTGYGEAGATGPIARARIETMKPLLIGKDPLDIEVSFQQMSSLMYNYVAHIPTVSGIDIALWDLAGKITNLPVSTLLGGRFRETISMYSHGIGLDMLDKASCREWAARIKQLPEGFTVYKNNIHEILHVPSGVFAHTLTTAQLRDVRTGYENVREPSAMISI